MPISPAPGCSGLRILFLHGYGLSPELIEMIGALDGLKAVLPAAHIHTLAGFEKIDFTHAPTVAAFDDPINALTSIRAFGEQTGADLFAWASFRSPSAEAGDPPDIVQRGYAREDGGAFTSVTDRLLRLIDSDSGGGFDVVVGFSQGGEHASVLASRLSSGRYERTHGGRMPTKFFLAGAELGTPLEASGDHTGKRMRFDLEEHSEGDATTVDVADGGGGTGTAATAAKRSPPLDVSLILVAGEKDDDAHSGMLGWMEQLRANGLQRVSAAAWSGDHRMPPAGDAVYDAVLKELRLP